MLEERSLLSTATLTSLGISAATTVYGQTEVLTATVTTSPPSGTTPSGGTVTFMDGSAALASESLTSGVATFSTIGLAVGLHVLTAVYNGTAAFAPSQSGINEGSIIDSVAGGGVGDGGSALAAPINSPYGVAEYNGNIFIADLNDNRIRMVNETAGVISTVAGDGIAGYSGNGGPATSAMLDDPTGIISDGAGHLFIADTLNNAIRELNLSTGIITTVAGTGSRGYSGDGGPATSAMLAVPDNIALDHAGDLFIADTGNNVIREVSAATGTITTVAGDNVNGDSGDGGPATSAKLNLPQAVAVDASGNILIADSFNNKVRKVSAATHVITTIAGTGVVGHTGNGGQATSAELAEPVGLALTSSGVLLIAEFENNDVRALNLSSGVINAFAGTGVAGNSGNGGPAASAELNGPQSIAFDSSGNLLIADGTNNLVRRVSAATAAISTVAGNGTAGFFGDGGPATSAALGSPRGIAVNSSGSIFVADTGNNRIREINPLTGVITTIAGTGQAGYSGNGGLATAATLNAPEGIAIDSQGNLFFADTQNDVIREISAATGVITTVAGNHTAGSAGDGGAATAAELNQPYGVAVDSSGNIFIADTGNARIREVSAATGIISTVAGNGTPGSSGNGGLATSAELNLPQSVVVDPQGNIFIADTGNDVIREVNATTKRISTVVGTGVPGFSGNGGPATAAELNFPTNLALDSSGDLFFADSQNNEIREVIAATGIINAVAGTGVAGYSGNGGSPTSAKLNGPIAIAIGPSGNLYITDRLNEVIREVSTRISGGQDVTVSPAPQLTPPSIQSETAVISQKFNKKHRPIGKPTLSGYTITFSTAMDQSALSNGNNYQVALKVPKTVKVKVGKKTVKQKVIVLKPIGFSVAQVTANSVTLKLAGKQIFPNGGQITIIAAGVDDTAGVFLAQNGVLAIGKGGKSITFVS
jgi:sugar lactone lactonase YvrE